MNDNKPFPANAATMTALMNGLGAVTLVLLEQMSMEQRLAAAQAFARLAAMAERQGDLTLETVLMDLHRAAQTAAQ